MRQSTLGFYYFIKWLELGLLTMFTTLIMGSGVYLLRQEFDQHDFMADDK